jgi:hypothetical protein
VKDPFGYGKGIKLWFRVNALTGREFSGQFQHKGLRWPIRPVLLSAMRVFSFLGQPGELSSPIT